MDLEKVLRSLDRLVLEEDGIDNLAKAPLFGDLMFEMGKSPGGLNSCEWKTTLDIGQRDIGDVDGLEPNIYKFYIFKDRKIIVTRKYGDWVCGHIDVFVFEHDGDYNISHLRYTNDEEI